MERRQRAGLASCRLLLSLHGSFPHRDRLRVVTACRMHCQRHCFSDVETVFSLRSHAKKWLQNVKNGVFSSKQLPDMGILTRFDRLPPRVVL